VRAVCCSVCCCVRRRALSVAVCVIVGYMLCAVAVFAAVCVGVCCELTDPHFGWNQCLLYHSNPATPHALLRLTGSLHYLIRTLDAHCMCWMSVFGTSVFWNECVRNECA